MPHQSSQCLSAATSGLLLAEEWRGASLRSPWLCLFGWLVCCLFVCFVGCLFVWLFTYCLNPSGSVTLSAIDFFLYTLIIISEFNIRNITVIHIRMYVNIPPEIFFLKLLKMYFYFIHDSYSTVSLGCSAEQHVEDLLWNWPPASRLPAGDKTQPFGWMSKKIKFWLEGHFQYWGKLRHFLLPLMLFIC